MNAIECSNMTGSVNVVMVEWMDGWIDRWIDRKIMDKIKLNGMNG